MARKREHISVIGVVAVLDMFLREYVLRNHAPPTLVHVKQ